MNRALYGLKRLVCCVKGHRPFPDRQVLETPPEPKTYTLGGLGVTGSVLSSGGTWASLSGSSVTAQAGVTFSCGPVVVAAKICSRCHGLYWISKPNGQWFLNVKTLPELDEYMKWQDRQNWETAQRTKNELAEKLYKQYQMALKLGYIPGDSDDQA